MITGIGSIKTNPCRWINIGTHNGIFHGDETVGIAIVDLATPEVNLFVVRTRDLDKLKELDIVIDVGGGPTDHHASGFDQRRPTGEMYASAGLMWKEYGVYAIETVIKQYKITGLTDEDIAKIHNQLDKDLILPVDLEDNGEKVSFHTFSFISSFLPPWNDADPDYNDAFLKAEKVTFEILKNSIKEILVTYAAKKFLLTRFAEYNVCPNHLMQDGILEIPSQTMPWIDEVVKFNKDTNNAVKFIIFPYPAGGWAAQCVPPSLEEKFKQLVPFPEEWAGLSEKDLRLKTGIYDSSFCHKGRFFARANSKASVIDMCRIAIAQQA